MFVSRIDKDGKMTSALRDPGPCSLRRNGSFIDIWLTYNKEKIFIAINIDDLKRAVELKEDGDSIQCWETHDEKLD